VPALVDKVRAGDAVIVPDCIKEVPVEANHVEIFDTIDEGYALLPGNIRLPREYRKDVGDHANEEAAPIHPSLDNELGDFPVVLSKEYQDDIIHENNQVAEGNVYVPPSTSESAPCMNGGYDPKKAVEVPVASVSDWKMNLLPSDDAAPTFTRSPNGDALTAIESNNCDRRNNITSRDHKNNVVALDEKFVPRAGDSPRLLETYVPSATTSRHEEDLMNFDKTQFADIKGQMGVDAAQNVDPSRGPARIEDSVQFKPKEPLVALTPKSVGLSSKPTLKVYEPTRPDFMNEGLQTTNLADPDCTENGGNDGYSTQTFSSAMKNSVSKNMPETLEAQLNLFKGEDKHIVDDSMIPSTVHSEEQLSTFLPHAPNQPQAIPPADFGTAVNGVSADEEGDRLARINHRASHKLV